MIDTAILLAAGHGSRLRDAAPLKPLCAVAGVPLIDRALTSLATAGIARAIVVTGYEAATIEAHLASRDWPITVETARTRDWRQPNGVSALAAAGLIDGETLLAMCDHIVQPALYARLAEAGAGGGLRLGIDRRLGHPWIDPEDVTCVASEGDRIVAIGKGMEPHDCSRWPRRFSMPCVLLPSRRSPKACVRWRRTAARASPIAATSTGSMSTTPRRLPRRKRGWLARRAFELTGCNHESGARVVTASSSSRPDEGRGQIGKRSEAPTNCRLPTWTPAFAGEVKWMAGGVGRRSGACPFP